MNLALTLPMSMRRDVLLVGAVVATAVIALWPSFGSLLDNWREIYDYRHGYLIAGVSATWLIVTLRSHRAPAARMSWIGTGMLAFGLFAWVVAHRANSIAAIQLLFPLLLWLAVLSVGGWSIARAAIAPIAYLYFAVPVWEYLLPLLQRMSVLVTETMLSFAGVPAVITEYSVKIPSGTFEIIEGCSGKRYFVVTLAFAVVAGVLQRIRGLRLMALILAAGGLALAANWIRIFVIIYAGHLTDMQHYLVDREHQSFGNILFVLLLAGVYVLSRRFAGEAVNSRNPGTGQAATGRWTGGVAQGIPFLLLVAALAVTHVAGASAGASGNHLNSLPFVTGNWAGPLPATPGWLPRYVQPGSERRAAYRSRDGRIVDIYLNMYEEQHPGRELVFHKNTLLAPGTWKQGWPVTTEQLRVDTAPTLTSFVARAPSGQTWLLAYVYRIGDWDTTHEALAQAAYGLQSVLHPTPAGVIALAVQCQDNCQEAQELVRTFWRDLSGPILQSIPDHEG